MLRMCVYMHSRFVKNDPIRILEDGPLISEVVLSQGCNVAYLRLVYKIIFFVLNDNLTCFYSVLPQQNLIT
jgi:hypothetical protein